MKIYLLILAIISLGLTTKADNEFHFRKTEFGFQVNQGQSEIIQFNRIANTTIQESNDFIILIPRSNIEKKTSEKSESFTDHHKIELDFGQFLLENQQLKKSTFLKEISKVQFYNSKDQNLAFFNYTTLWRTSPTERPFFQVSTKVIIYKAEKELRRIDFCLTVRALRYDLDLYSNEQSDAVGILLQLSDESKSNHYKTTTFQNSLLATNTEIKKANALILYTWNSNPMEINWNYNFEKSIINSYQESSKMTPISIKGDQTFNYTIFVSSKAVKGNQFQNIVKKLEKSTLTHCGD